MQILIVFSALLAVAYCRPGILLQPQPIATLSAVSPIAYAQLVPGAPIGLDGRVVDTPEVAVAKAEHAAAHINERIGLAQEAVKSADRVLTYTTNAQIVHPVAQIVQPVALATKIVPGAPIGPDGRVVDTAEVALAKAEHTAAHINEKFSLAEEAARSSSADVPIVLSAYAAPVVQKYLV